MATADPNEPAIGDPGRHAGQRHGPKPERGPRHPGRRGRDLKVKLHKLPKGRRSRPLELPIVRTVVED